jgi:predicted NBD/HSP70 family sugar kinase
MWWIGDHEPRHVHVYDKDGRTITRVDLETMQPMDTPTVERKILTLIRELQDEGRL